jgi:hypothetical protein
MELIIPFRKEDFSNDGMHIPSDRFIMELQRDWEEAFYERFKPIYANAIEGHPSAMLRLTLYMDGGEKSDFDFGMELIDGNIDIDTNLKIEEYSKLQTVYAIGSQFHENEDEPLLLLKNDGLKEEILIIKYVPDDDRGEIEPDKMPIESISIYK